MAVRYCDPCKTIKQRNPAIFLCLDCQEDYCDKCKTDHSKFRVLRRHKIIRTNENKDDSFIEPDEEANFKMGSVYVPFKESLMKRVSGYKFDRKETLTRSLSLNSLSLSSDEYLYADVSSDVYSDTKCPEHHEYDYIDIDVKTSDAVKNDVGNLRKPEGSVYVSSDQVDLPEKDDIGGSSGMVNKPVYPKRTEDCVLYQCTVFVDGMELAKRIGIQNKTCSLRMYSDKIVLLADSNVVFEALFTTIRRFSQKEKIFTIEFGRQCKYGQGELRMISTEAKIIHDVLKRTTASTKTKFSFIATKHT